MRIEEIVAKLIENHNFKANCYTCNLKTKNDYEKLLAPVFQMYEEHKDWSMQQYYAFLYETSGIEKKIKSFIIERKRAAGAVISFGTELHRDIIIVGNQQEINDSGFEECISMHRNAIFDLSSVTKLFTCLTVLKLVENDILKLTDDIYELDQRFKNLQGVSIQDLLSFRVPLRTDKRIEDANELEEAEQLLFSIKPDMTKTRLYSDMGAMILKYVVERKTKSDFYELVSKYILKPCEMKDTTVYREAVDGGAFVSNNYERRIINGKYIVIKDIARGSINDGKARKLNSFKVQLHGHAGLFSTVDDMSCLVRNLMQGNIISLQLLNELGINRTGIRKEDGSYSQFHGYLCYSKNPICTNSEVNHFMSGNAFALGGYTGNHLAVDVANGVFSIMASNRCHNRVTMIDGNVEQYLKDGNVLWEDGKEYVYNKQFAYERDEYIVSPAIELALQYRALEMLVDKEELSENVVEHLL